MSRADPKIRYQHMLDNARKARELADDIKESDLDTDWIRTYALVRALEVIGEAAGHIPVDEQKQQSGIPWAQIVSLRNRLIHGYDSVDLSILWRIIHDDLMGLFSWSKTAVQENNSIAKRYSNAKKCFANRETSRKDPQL